MYLLTMQRGTDSKNGFLHKLSWPITLVLPAGLHLGSGSCCVDTGTLSLFQTILEHMKEESPFLMHGVQFSSLDAVSALWYFTDAERC